MKKQHAFPKGMPLAQKKSPYFEKKQRTSIKKLHTPTKKMRTSVKKVPEGIPLGLYFGKKRLYMK